MAKQKVEEDSKKISKGIGGNGYQLFCKHVFIRELAFGAIINHLFQGEKRKRNGFLSLSSKHETGAVEMVGDSQEWKKVINLIVCIYNFLLWGTFICKQKVVLLTVLGYHMLVAPAASQCARLQPVVLQATNQRILRCIFNVP